MADKGRLSFRQTKKSPNVIADISSIAKRKERSLNYIIETALLEYIKRNKK